MAGSVTVTVYTKAECSLCGPVLKTVDDTQAELAFTLSKIDITGDSQLLQRYGHEVPVVLINGRKAFKGTLTAQAFRKKLQKAGALPPTQGPSVGSLEELSPKVPAPPAYVTLGLAALMVAGSGYYVRDGVMNARLGQGRLAEQLLRVERRDEPPKTMRLQAMEGGEVSLDAFRGKVVFINFWATWCPPCIEEMPSMRRLSERMKNDPRFVMLAVSADDNWPPVREFFKRDPASFRVLLDPSGALAKTYGTSKFPETYVVVDGHLVGYIIGPRDWDTWYAEAYLRALLEQGPLG